MNYIILFLAFLLVLALIMPLNMAIWGAVILSCIVFLQTQKGK